METFDAAVEIIADPEKWRPETRETADHSLPYCVAVALQDGEVGLDQFSEERIADPTLLDLVSRVEVESVAELSDRYPASTPNRITVTIRSGHPTTPTRAAQRTTSNWNASSSFPFSPSFTVQVP
jgi:2-methylcitrate dehydratase